MTVLHAIKRAVGVRLAARPNGRFVRVWRSDMRKVLLIEDDDASAQALGEILELEGYAVRRARNGADAIDVLQTYTPDVVLVDLQLPVMDGRSFIELYRRRVRPAASVIVMSGRPDGSAIANAVGADAYVRKPLEANDLLRTLSLTLAVA